MSWIVYLILATIVIEIPIIWIYFWTRNNASEQTPWVILGTKVVKLLIAVIAIVAVHFLADNIPLRDFCFGVVAAYFVSMVIETVLFLKKKK